MIRSFSRGFSVIEIIMAAALVGLLTTLVFAAFSQGLRGLFKSREQSELLSQLQLSSRRIADTMDQGSFASVTLQSLNLSPQRHSDAVSFLTSYDDNGDPQLNGSTAPLWTAYLVYYHDAPEDRVRVNRVDLRTGASQITFPTPIEKYSTSTGTHPISFYRKDGDIVARYIHSFQVETVPSLPNGYEITLNALLPAQGDNKADSTSNLKFTVVMRN